jgi:hypothetical protein
MEIFKIVLALMAAGVKVHLTLDGITYITSLNQDSN